MLLFTFIPHTSKANVFAVTMTEHDEVMPYTVSWHTIISFNIYIRRILSTLCAHYVVIPCQFTVQVKNSLKCRFVKLCIVTQKACAGMVDS